VTFTPLLRAPAIVRWHIAGALVALAPGTAVLFMRKGTRIHRRIGWFWVGAMFSGGDHIVLGHRHSDRVNSAGSIFSRS
jgi:uncharacterized membrane protein